MNQQSKLSNYQLYADRIRELTDDQLKNIDYLINQLTIEKNDKVRVTYCPFEWQNPQAKLMIIGITPGPTQLRNALTAFRSAIRQGLDEQQVLKVTKLAGAFSGDLRINLVKLLDVVGLHKYAGVPTCESFFGTHSHLVHTTSLISNATFLLDGTPYNGTPNPMKNDLLRKQIFDGLLHQISVAKDALLLPLGPTVDKVIQELCEQGLIDPKRVLFGMPHPGGQNGERVKYFLGQKKAEICSIKTNTALIDSRKKEIMNKISVLQTTV